MTESDGHVQRRALLRTLGLGAAAAGAAAVGGTAWASPAAADDGEAVVLGDANDATSTTSLTSTGPGYGLFVRILSQGTSVGAESLDGDGVHGTSYKPAAAAVRASGRTGAHGIVATAQNGIGGVFEGATAAVRLVPQSTVGAPTSGAHQRGELLIDSTGALSVCRSGGTPGTWKKVKLV